MQTIDDIKVLGALIRATRKEQHLTQEQLAIICGVGVRFLKELEEGKLSCQIGKVLKVMQMLGINLLAAKKDSL